MIMKKAIFFIFLGLSSASCTSSRTNHLIQATGLDECILKGADFVPGDTPDMIRLRFHPQDDCYSRMIKSIDVAAGQFCSKLVDENNGCYYNYHDYSVMIGREGSDNIYVVSVYK
jgi:hypothetical protein